MHTTGQTITRPVRRAAAAAGLALAAALATALLAAPAEAAQRPAKASSLERVWSPQLELYLRTAHPKRIGYQLATWYGPGFYGNGTACGTRLTTGSWGIAHRTLPCGTMVHLKYRGKEVAVPVMDRGPFSGADIDLTGRTAHYLGFGGAGLVRMKVLGKRMTHRQLRKLNDSTTWPGVQVDASLQRSR